MTPLEFRRYLWRQKLESLGYHGVVCVILILAVLVQNRRVANERTDGPTYDDSIYCASIASSGKKWSRINMQIRTNRLNFKNDDDTVTWVVEPGHFFKYRKKLPRQ